MTERLAKKYFEFSQNFEMVNLEIITLDKCIARFCVQGIELFTLEEHSRTPYLQSKNELSPGHTLEYGYFVERDV